MQAPVDPKVKAKTSYNRASDHYEDSALGFWSRYGTATVERLSLSAGQQVLDVCSGTGASAIPAAERVGPTGSVIAVDLADRLLALGRAKAAGRGLHNIQFRVGDMERLGLPDNAFDAVICVFGIFFSPDMPKQLRELWRMVRPGGNLAITTWGPRFWEPAYSVWNQAVQRERPDLVAAFNPWDRITTTEGVLQLFTDAGIAEPRVVREDGEQPLRAPEDWWTIALGSGLRWAIEQMGPERAERVRQDNVAWLKNHSVRAVETNVIYAVATK
jgi:ubiquinone/menaquinone biosynthesis C-methylase UbiE